jgi:hypothetical protein
MRIHINKTIAEKDEKTRVLHQKNDYPGKLNMSKFLKSKMK